jgi:integrase
MSKSWPQGTHFENWILITEEGNSRIRRHVTLPEGKHKYERMEIKKYRHILTATRKEQEDFVIRLNGRDPQAERAKANLTLRHAYIDPELLHDYLHNYLLVQIPTKKDALTMFNYLQKHTLDFFINKLKLIDPLDWLRQQHIWARYLLNQEDATFQEDLRIFPHGEVRSAKVLRQTVNETNRFMRYLHQRRPDEVPALKFEPFTRAALKNHDGKRKLADEDYHPGRHIRPDVWDKIKNELERQGPQWRFPVYLAYYYGLRRNEAMGLTPRDVRKGYLSIERQFEAYDHIDAPIYRPLKNRQVRQVPHWFMSPSIAHEWINGMIGMRIHPDSLSRNFIMVVEKLGLEPFLFHDLRRSFLTNAARDGRDAEQLRLAAGHSSPYTTYKFYVKDSRQMEDEIWEPGGAA